LDETSDSISVGIVSSAPAFFRNPIKRFGDIKVVQDRCLPPGSAGFAVWTGGSLPAFVTEISGADQQGACKGRPQFNYQNIGHVVPHFSEDSGSMICSFCSSQKFTVDHQISGIKARPWVGASLHKALTYFYVERQWKVR